MKTIPVQTINQKVYAELKLAQEHLDNANNLFFDSIEDTSKERTAIFEAQKNIISLKNYLHDKI